MKYDAHKRLKDLFLKNQFAEGFNSDEIAAATRHITTHIDNLFHSGKSNKNSYSSITNLLERLITYEDYETYDRVFVTTLRKCFSKRSPSLAQKVMQSFDNLFKIFIKDSQFYEKNFELFFPAKEKKERENYMNLASSIFKDHVADLRREIEEEKMKQTISSYNPTLFVKKSEEEKEVEFVHNPLENMNISANAIIKGNPQIN